MAAKGASKAPQHPVRAHRFARREESVPRGLMGYWQLAPVEDLTRWYQVAAPWKHHDVEGPEVKGCRTLSVGYRPNAVRAQGGAVPGPFQNLDCGLSSQHGVPICRSGLSCGAGFASLVASHFERSPRGRLKRAYPRYGRPRADLPSKSLVKYSMIAFTWPSDAWGHEPPCFAPPRSNRRRSCVGWSRPPRRDNRYRWSYRACGPEAPPAQVPILKEWQRGARIAAPYQKLARSPG
jgi:hypothetical protein